ncbi:pilus motility taxis protein HmpF [Coleofasciculus sp.]|uniref:pilus motility taxis protein HmpF n=1 Tax=Coleofasciculus sp. TaxID=3100458 RepID=UPI0039FAA99A
MLYLAEVKKQKSGFASFGGSKAELKLLACQRNDQSWSAVPGEETIPGDEAGSMGDGALVIVNLGNNRQVQGDIEPAGTRLANILQNFSRLLEKAKSQEEEIEQWKQSLTYQSQELNRREMEMEARLEQMQALEEEAEQIDQQRQDIESAQEESERLKEEFERKQQELEGAWEHLRGEQRRLEEQQADRQQTSGLSEEDVAAMQELLDRLSTAVAPTDTVREQLNQAFEIVDQQQSELDNDWQKLEYQRQQAEQRQTDIDEQELEIQRRKQELDQVQTSFEEAQAEFKVQQNAWEMKQESVHILSLQLQTHQELHQELARLATTSADVKISQEVDIQGLENMPLGELQEIVQNLQQDLERVVRFVNDQEEELTFQRQSVEEIQEKINNASEYDRISLETELADEQDRYQMLDETLVGQRRNLREREEILNQHVRVLRRRQGISDGSSDDTHKIDLGPVLNQLEAQRQQQESELEKLESQVEQMRQSISQAEEMIAQQASEQDAKRSELQSLEENWQSMQMEVAELWSQVNLYQEILPSKQEALNQIRQILEAIAEALNQIQEVGDYQLQAISEMRQTVDGMVESPELAAS